MTVTQETIQQMYDWQVPDRYYQSDEYIAWLMSEYEKENPSDDTMTGVAFGEYLYQ